MRSTMDVLNGEGLGWSILNFGLMPVTSVISMVINFILGYAFITHEKWDTTTIIFFSLTVSDFFCGVFSLTGVIFRMISSINFRLGQQMTIMTEPYFYLYIYNIPKCLSISLTALLSIERSIAVIYPLKIKTIWTKKRVKWLICCWVVLIFLAKSPACFQWQVLDGDVENSTVSGTLNLEITSLARNHTHKFEILTMSGRIFGRYLPTCIVLVFNVITACGISKVAKKRKELKGQNTKDDVRKLSPPQQPCGNRDPSPKHVQTQPFPKGSGAISSEKTISSVPFDDMLTIHLENASYRNVTSESVKSSDSKIDEHISNISSSVTQSSDKILQYNHDKFHANKAQSRNQKMEKSSSETSTERRITITILLVTSVFIVLVILEIGIYLLLQADIAHGNTAIGSYESFTNAWTITNYIALINSILNVIIYVFRTKKYKAIVFKMLPCGH